MCSTTLIGGEKEFFGSLVAATCLLLLVVLFGVSSALIGLCAIVNLL